MKTILNNIILLSKLSGILLVFAVILMIPQVNIPEYVLPTITSKLIYFLYGILTLCAIYTFNVFFSKEIIFSFSKIDIALFVLILYISFNRYFIQAYYGFSIRYLESLGLSFLYVVLRSIGVKNYYWLLSTVVLSGIIQVVYGNLQLLNYYPSNHSGFKMTGSFFNPGPYTGFLLSVWIVALGMYLYKEEIIKQIQQQQKKNSPFLNEVIKYTFEYIPLLGLISIAILLPALQSRASWIAAIVGSIVLLELKYSFLQSFIKRLITRSYKIVVLSISTIILSVSIFSLYHFKKASSDGRAFIWKVTTEMILDNAIFGVGFDCFNKYYMNYQAQYFEKNGETSESLVADNTYYAFNEALQFVSENGLLGLVLLLILLYFLFQVKIKKGFQLYFFIAKTGLLTIGVFGCFSYPMQILPIKLILVILLATLSNSTLDSYQFKITENIKKKWLYKMSFILLVCITMSQTLAYTKDLSQGFITWNNALMSHQYGDYKEAIINFKKAYPILKKNGDFLMNYGKTLSISGESNKAIEVLKKAQHYQNNTIIATALGDSYKAIKAYDKAELAYQQAINMTPGKFYAHYLLAKLYDDSGQKKKAIAMANKIINKEIKIPSTAIKEIQEEMKNILIKYKNPPGF